MVENGTSTVIFSCERGWVSGESMARAYHKLSPKFLQFGASRGGQVSVAGGTCKTTPDVAGASTTCGGILTTPKFLELARQLLDLRHSQRKLLLLLIEQGSDAVQIGSCERTGVKINEDKNERERINKEQCNREQKWRYIWRSILF